MIKKQTWLISGGGYQLPKLRLVNTKQQGPPAPDIPEEKYLRVRPTIIYLMPSNNFTDDVDILSNVIWTTN